MEYLINFLIGIAGSIVGIVFFMWLLCRDWK